MGDVIKGIVYTVTAGAIVYAGGTLTGDPEFTRSLAFFVVVIFLMIICVEKLQKTIAKQQTQIDTLTRELEEVKRKMEG